MSITTSQQINRYFDLYKDAEITFNTQVIQVLGLLVKQLYLKCASYMYPCLLYSSSMVGAKVIAHLRPAALQNLRNANNLVSLHVAFKIKDKVDPLSLFISVKLISSTPYNQENPDMFILSLAYTQKPPDDLIEILGKLLEANINAKRRKEARILITPESLKVIGLNSRESLVTIGREPRKCLIRDLSFSGAKILFMGQIKELVGQETVLEIPLKDQEPIKIPGVIIRYEEVQDRNDIAAIAILFAEDKIPMVYKLHINEYLRVPRYGSSLIHSPQAGQSENNKTKEG